MPTARYSTRHADDLDDLDETITDLQDVLESVVLHLGPPQAAELAVTIERLSAGVARLRVNADVMDDAFRAIGAIAQAGPHTLKVQRTLREIVAGHDRITGRDVQASPRRRRARAVRSVGTLEAQVIEADPIYRKSIRRGEGDLSSTMTQVADPCRHIVEGAMRKKRDVLNRAGRRIVAEHDCYRDPDSGYYVGWMIHE